MSEAVALVKMPRMQLMEELNQAAQQSGGALSANLAPYGLLTKEQLANLILNVRENSLVAT